VLFLATTTGYQTRTFGDAAARLGVQLVFATDCCDQLEDPWWDSAIPIRFHQERTTVDVIMRALERTPVDGVLAVGDRATVIAAFVARLLGLPGHPPEAAAAARDKRLTRERLRAGRLPVPSFTAVPLTADARAIARTTTYPCVLKPLVLSGSRGVMRADNETQFVSAFDRLQILLNAPDVRAMRDAAADVIQIESFVPGREYALEGLMHHGELQTLAIFDKPDPLDGPFFEETLYVTPSRAPEVVQQDVRKAVSQAARALGLHHGPVHAECRVNAEGVYVLEVAARPIGGLCARSLAFEGSHGRIGLEELLLRHALGESPAAWVRQPQASGVMMIPIPRAGVYRRVEGVDRARAVPGIAAVEITAKPDQQLVPLPEGASYLGFIFATGDTPAGVERALRTAHEHLHFVIDREIKVQGFKSSKGSSVREPLNREP
jgi:biotin carboxylase